MPGCNHALCPGESPLLTVKMSKSMFAAKQTSQSLGCLKWQAKKKAAGKKKAEKDVPVKDGQLPMKGADCSDSAADGDGRCVHSIRIAPTRLDIQSL